MVVIAECALVQIRVPVIHARELPQLIENRIRVKGLLSSRAAQASHLAEIASRVVYVFYPGDFTGVGDLGWAIGIVIGGFYGVSLEILAEIPGRFRHAPSYIVAEPLRAFAIGDLVQLPLKDSVVRVGARAVVSVGDRGIGAVRTTGVIVIVVVGVIYFFRLQPPEWVIVMIPNPVVIRVKLPGQASRVVVLVRPESHVGIADGTL